MAKLYGWQQNVIDIIDKHDDFRGGEAYQQLSGYAINKLLGVTICLPPESGHTYLARYIAEKYASAIIYTDTKHYHEFDDLTSNKSETISMYEIYYILNKPDIHQPSDELVELNHRISEKKVIVIDKANKIPQVVKDYLYNTATGIVIMLG